MERYANETDACRFGQCGTRRCTGSGRRRTAIGQDQSAEDQHCRRHWQRQRFPRAVEVTVTNTSNKTVRVPKWQLPSDFIEAKVFNVSRDGQAVDYEGPMIKRGLPQAQDFAILRAGESYRTTIDLSAAYDLSRTGQYMVSFASPLQHASTSDGAMLKQANGLPMVAQSAPLRLWVDGSDQLGAAKGGDDQREGQARRRRHRGQRRQLRRLHRPPRSTPPATPWSRRATTPRTPRATSTPAPWARATRPGSAPIPRRATTPPSSISSPSTPRWTRAAGQVKINCGCNQNYYAYVYPTRPYEIFVCRAFWTAPLTGTDSKAGTLIHEMSHFNVVAGTDDVVYGQAGAKNLAITDPNGALNNADNHEYFAENTPSQN